MTTESEVTQVAEPTESLDEPSAPFVGRWSHLVSRTNWEKGRIILEWRAELERRGLPASAASDEAWARKVGGVTPQHVGRLRRVYQRFGECHAQYPGLYWSHFQAALEWDDAEMWLEGAVQSKWSVAAMRRQRAATLEQPVEDPAPLGEVVEVDASFVRALDAVPLLPDDAPATASPKREKRPGTGHSTPRTDRADRTSPPDNGVPFDLPGDDPEPVAERPFEALTAELPEDFQEALELFKLAILRHKQNDWRQVAPQDVLAALDGLRRLVQSG